jgi:2-succinyl-5-enolpyruvyl-6-hydroxy-3-cyclohexene-1-carboxylate synthase
MSNLGQKNIDFSYTIIDQLISHGVDFFCISPGARNTSLVLSIAKHKKARSITHSDERAISYLGLGYAKATKKPACIITTSGTAVGNCLPAIMESYYSNTPLIVITADRPIEKRLFGDNQSADQIKIFQNYVNWQICFSPSDKSLNKDFIKTVIAYANYSSCIKKGPVHINCAFREPFFDKNNLTYPKPESIHKYTIPKKEFTLDKDLLKNLVSKKGIIIAGENASFPEIIDLANFLNWPLFANILSNIKNEKSNNLIPHYDKILSSSIEEEMSPEIILHFGKREIFKNFQNWIKDKQIENYIHITEEENFCFNPQHKITNKILCETKSFCENILSSDMVPNKNRSYLEKWQKANQKEKASLKRDENFSQKSIFKYLSSYIPKNHPIFISNSTAIRDADKYLFPINTNKIFANRGVSGIDGNISTAIGIANGLKKPLLAIIGDMAFIHDLNALFMIKKQTYPITIILLNNHGGQIFSKMDIANLGTIADQFFIDKHDMTFENVAKQFKIDYSKATSFSKLDICLKNAFSNKSSNIIEVIID